MAGLEGEWRRIVYRMDYQDLLPQRHNFTTPVLQSRTGGSSDNINEAIRLFRFDMTKP